MLIPIDQIKKLSPLIHCITNPISINQCANAILAVGGRPMMAEHPREVAEITETAAALVLNTGNITDVRMQSIAISAKTAKQHNIPMIVDAVGTACSKMRLEYLLELFEQASPSVIKGNYSEITALYQTGYRSSGVDADAALSLEQVSVIAARLAEKYNCTVLASGKVDIVTDGKTLVHIKNGSPRLSSITGTGCMLGALCGCCLSVTADLSAAVTACAMLGISGQLAQNAKGSGSFAVELFDNLSNLDDDILKKYLDIEVTEIEKI